MFWSWQDPRSFASLPRRPARDVPRELSPPVHVSGGVYVGSSAMKSKLACEPRAPSSYGQDHVLKTRGEETKQLPSCWLARHKGSLDPGPLLVSSEGSISARLGFSDSTAGPSCQGGKRLRGPSSVWGSQI